MLAISFGGRVCADGLVVSCLSFLGRVTAVCVSIRCVKFRSLRVKTHAFARGVRLGSSVTVGGCPTLCLVPVVVSALTIAAMC